MVKEIVFDNSKIQNALKKFARSGFSRLFVFIHTKERKNLILVVFLFLMTFVAKLMENCDHAVEEETFSLALV